MYNKHYGVYFIPRPCCTPVIVVTDADFELEWNTLQTITERPHTNNNSQLVNKVLVHCKTCKQSIYA